MPKYNEKFKLTPQDIELIERALQSYRYDPKSMQYGGAGQGRVIELMAKLHHQKQWYRPTKEPYISG